MGKQALQGSERNFFEVGLALQSARSTLENASFKIADPNQDGLPDFIDNESPLAKELKQMRENAKSIMQLVQHINKSVAGIKTGIDTGITIEPLVELDDLEGINREDLPEIGDESLSGEPFMDLSGMPFRGHGEDRTEEQNSGSDFL